MRFHYIPKILIHCTMLKWAPMYSPFPDPYLPTLKKNMLAYMHYKL